jgi:hypothetical protein
MGFGSARRTVRGGSLLLLVGLGGCSWESHVVRHAENDLKCPAQDIQVVDEPGSGNWTARGCGRTQKYYCATPHNAPHCWKR